MFELSDEKIVQGAHGGGQVLIDPAVGTSFDLSRVENFDLDERDHDAGLQVYCSKMYTKTVSLSVYFGSYVFGCNQIPMLVFNLLTIVRCHLPFVDHQLVISFIED